MQQESRIAAHQSIEAMQEQAAQISCRRKLADMFDITLPAQERRGPESAVFGTMVDVVDPSPQPLI